MGASFSDRGSIWSRRPTCSPLKTTLRRSTTLLFPLGTFFLFFPPPYDPYFIPDTLLKPWCT
ncbi:hypothetical protein QC763_0015660 [Podospora pseudopauciseta]|uniref:Uncharacterized protein n=1 Tax=Podospora pseudopauciseta TaxID=2093780 RepID=A0ABR0I0U4_9PEZI|nr:hypothetical protein QC763_0015660 [Podospora pseudopauciseta]